MPTFVGPTLDRLIEQVRNGDKAAIAAALELLTKESKRIATIVDPPTVVQSKVNQVTLPAPANVSVFDYELRPDSILLTWEAPSTDFLLYEIRQGSDWNTATRLTTTSALFAILDPSAIGTTTYLIKAINDSGVYSLSVAFVSVVVPSLGTFTITPSVINNFINLDWTEPVSTFLIDYYRITKDGSTIASRVRGSFYSRQEAQAGSFTYGVTAIDIAGNESSEATVTVDVNGPQDFEIQDEQTSQLNGTIVNGKVDNERLVICIDTTKTFQDHFDDNSWTSPQDQIDAGYTLFIEPTLTTASYEETFDFGTIYQNVIVNLSWLFQVISGSFTFGLDVRVSDDNLTYSSAFTTSSFFVTSARYIKVKFTFTGSSDKALLEFSQFICTLNVKRENDGGEADVFASDTDGTTINFNKSFKFVESITATVKQTSTRFVTYDFAGGANPTSFKIKVWDASGTRVDDTVSWHARGVL